MSTLTKLAAILSDLRTYHHTVGGPCLGIEVCPLLRIMGDIESLMTDLATTPAPSEPEATYGGGIIVTDCLAHPAEMVNPPPTTIDPTDLADAIIRARASNFMPATRLCVLCDAPLPTDQLLTLNKCFTCRNAL